MYASAFPGPRPTVPGSDPRGLTRAGAQNYYDDAMRMYAPYAASPPPIVHVGQVGGVSDDFATTTMKWTHTDTRGFEGAVTAAIARGQAGTWDDLGAPQDLRALLVGGFAMYNALGGGLDVTKDPVTGAITSFQLNVRAGSDFSGDSNRHELGLCGPRALMGAASYAIAQMGALGGGGTLYPNGDTVDGGPVLDATVITGGGTGVGFAWPAAVAVCAGIAGAVYLGEKALEVYNAHLLRTDAMNAMLGAAAQAVAVAKNHAEAEAKAGKPIPLNGAEVAIVQGVNKTVDTAAKANDITLQPGLPSIFPDTTKVLNTAITTAGNVVSTGTIVAVGAAALAAIVLGPKLLAMHGK